MKITRTIVLLFLTMGYVNMANAEYINLIITNNGYEPPRVFNGREVSYAEISLQFDDKGYAMPIPAIGKTIQENIREEFVTWLKQSPERHLQISLHDLDEYEETTLHTPEQLIYKNLTCNVAKLKSIKITIFPDKLEVIEE